MATRRSPHYTEHMPFPKRENPDEFFVKLNDVQRPHLDELRRIRLSYEPQVQETLKWNQPAYTREGKMLWMLQPFAKHCSLRFTPEFFAPLRDDVIAAGYECGAGFLKILYTQEVPEALCRRLIEARLKYGD